MSIFTENFTDLLSLLAVVFIFREIMTYKDYRPLRYLLTPLVTLLIAGFALLAIAENGFSQYRLFILLGLVLSAVADSILMIKEVDLLKYGVVYFLAAHVMYIIAFSAGYHFSVWNVFLGLVLVCGVAFSLKKIWGKTGGMDIPLLVYALTISIMVFFAWTGLNSGFSRQGFNMLLGATLFIISDGLLAVNAFIKPLPADSVLVWTLYAPAQFFIAITCFG